MATIGAGVSYAGQQKQAAEVKRARNEQAAHTAAQKQLAQQQQDEELKLSKEKQDAIVDEAEEVSPNKRVEQIEAETIKAQESNVNAMEEANLLGEDSINQAGEGNYSDAYIQKKALDEANQTDAAIGMARLFGASTATGRAMQNNKINQIQTGCTGIDIDGVVFCHKFCGTAADFFLFFRKTSATLFVRQKGESLWSFKCCDTTVYFHDTAAFQKDVDISSDGVFGYVKFLT